ncbi:MAG TPA: Gfo/Idh/MocA family oxidoreductase [Armatimonadota bacterium]|nr:Gfo/Idh/MocA family oxidoreductase [Armatimonadota bacterium]
MQRVAVVGYGFMGQMHCNAYAALPNAELAVVVDPVTEKQEKAKADHGVATVSQLESVLDDPSIALIDICLPTYMHKEATVAALAAGKHVLCEKPMALNPNEAQAMIDAAERAEGFLMIAQCLRFWPEYAAAKRIVDSGELGRVKHVSCRRVSPRPTWSWENWLQQPEKSGSALLDLHVHDIDFIVYLLGKPHRVTARGVNDPTTGWDHVFATYEYDGAVAFAEGAWDYPPGFAFNMSFCIGLEGGAITYNVASSPTLTVARAGTSEVEHPELPKVQATSGATTGNISDMGGYFLEIDYLVGCIERGERPTRVPLQETALDIQIAFAEVESATRAVTVAL